MDNADRWFEIKKPVLERMDWSQLLHFGCGGIAERKDYIVISKYIVHTDAARRFSLETYPLTYLYYRGTGFKTLPFSRLITMVLQFMWKHRDLAQSFALTFTLRLDILTGTVSIG